MLWRIAAALLFTVALAGSARAEIYEWRDAAGSRHFTNSEDAVPAEHRSSARILVAERPRPEAAPAPQPVAAAGEAPRQAQVVYGGGMEEAYAVGLRDGLALAEANLPQASGGVQIHGPLAVAQANAAGPDVLYPSYPLPFVTTSFDRGRSRHLTLRMLLQDQFQLDRDGPFLHERFPPGVGPSFRVFLPRGLGQRFSPGNRVLFR